MLLEFGAYNYASFKEGFSVSLRLAAGCPKEISHGKQHSNLLAIKGANASGKTNVLKALSFLCHFAASSFDYKVDESIAVDNYFRNKDNTEFYAVFEKDGAEYKYELIVNEKEIISEILYKDDKEVLVRKNNTIMIKDENFNELDAIKKPRGNVSIISLARQYDLDSMNIFYSIFSETFSNVSYEGLNSEMINIDNVSKHYHENEASRDFTIDILRKADTGLENIIIVEKVDDETNEAKYYPLFTYLVGKEELPLTYDSQSSGVKALYKQLAAYYLALENGGLLILDELDINLHPDLLEAILELFEDPEINKHNAQLIFTTHNEKVIDQLKKYRMVFVNKDNNESYLYRLDETGEFIRNDRSLMPFYNARTLGGRPNLKFKNA